MKILPVGAEFIYADGRTERYDDANRRFSQSLHYFNTKHAGQAKSECKFSFAVSVLNFNFNQN